LNFELKKIDKTPPAQKSMERGEKSCKS